MDSVADLIILCRFQINTEVTFNGNLIINQLISISAPQDVFQSVSTVRGISLKLFTLFIPQYEVSQLSSWPGNPGHIIGTATGDVDSNVPGSNSSRCKRYFSSPEFQTESEAHSASYSIGTSVVSRGEEVET